MVNHGYQWGLSMVIYGLSIWLTLNPTACFYVVVNSG